MFCSLLVTFSDLGIFRTYINAFLNSQVMSKKERKVSKQGYCLLEHKFLTMKII